jgi:hypothetical protein
MMPRANTVLEKKRKRLSIDAGSGYMTPHPIHGQHPKGKKNSFFQFGYAENILKSLEHY